MNGLLMLFQGPLLVKCRPALSAHVIPRHQVDHGVVPPQDDLLHKGRPTDLARVLLDPQMNTLLVRDQPRLRGKRSPALATREVPPLKVDVLDVQHQAPPLRKGIATLSAYMLLDLEMHALLVEIQTCLLRVTHPTFVADVISLFLVDILLVLG